MSEFHPCSRFAGDPTPCDGNDETTSNCQCFQRAEGERAATERIADRLVKNYREFTDNAQLARIVRLVKNEENTDD